MKEGENFKKEFNESIPWTVFQRARVEANKILLNRQKMNEKEERRKESELQEKMAKLPPHALPKGYKRMRVMEKNQER